MLEYSFNRLVSEQKIYQLSLLLITYFEAKMSTIDWFPLLKYENMLVFLVCFQSKWNAIGVGIENENNHLLQSYFHFITEFNN